MKTIHWWTFSTPWGTCFAASCEDRLIRTTLPGEDWEKTLRELSGPDVDLEKKDLPIFTRTEREFLEYFSGRRQEFDLPLAFSGTDFQRKVWETLREIPYGATVTYEGIARKIGKPKASRAVGMANGKNPLPIVVPCHRVVGKDGGMVGFGGGVVLKQKLLRLEKSLLF